MKYSQRAGGETYEWMTWKCFEQFGWTAGQAATHFLQNAGTPSQLTNFTPLDIYCPTFETSVEIIFNSKASVSHNFSVLRACSRLDRWMCDLDGYWLNTPPKRKNNGWWRLVNTHLSMICWGMLREEFVLERVSNFLFAHFWTGPHRQGAPRSLWGSSRRHFDSGTHGYTFERWVCYSVRMLACNSASSLFRRTVKHIRGKNTNKQYPRVITHDPFGTLLFGTTSKHRKCEALNK